MIDHTLKPENIEKAFNEHYLGVMNAGSNPLYTALYRMTQEYLSSSQKFREVLQVWEADAANSFGKTDERGLDKHKQAVAFIATSAFIAGFRTAELQRGASGSPPMLPFNELPN